MSRILWLGNPPWGGSGYGEQAALAIPLLVEQGHDVALLCNWGLQGRETRWNGITCYPSDGEWGNAALGTFADLHRADQVIALCDAWVLRPDVWKPGLRAAVWTPVDHWPIPPPVLHVLADERIQPIAMSRFGDDLMETFGLDPIYIPHAVDTTLFRPQPEIRDAVRDELEIPREAFLVGMVAANVGGVDRKSFDESLLAFARFAREHDDVWMYAHTQSNKGGGGRGGLDLELVATTYQVPPGRLRFPHPETFQVGLPAAAVAYIYQAFDVLLNPSKGEGFGVPIIEAQASGVPVIVSNHSAMPELCGAGWIVEGQPKFDEAQSSCWIIPYVDHIVSALEAAYDARDDKGIRSRAVAFAAAYDAQNVSETYWKPALARLAEPAEVAA